jgi:hypothetical protein
MGITAQIIEDLLSSLQRIAWYRRPS